MSEMSIMGSERMLVEKILAQARMINQYQKGEDRINELNASLEAEIVRLKAEVESLKMA